MNFVMGLVARGFRLLRFGLFEVLYYPLAPVYDLVSQAAFLGQWSRWQRAALPRVQGKRVLEIGCGTGTLLNEMLARGFKAYGIDASGPMLRQAQAKLAAKDWHSRLVRARVTNLPFPDQSFETVVSTFPSNYIMQVAALKEINRVLYPGGRLVIVDDAELRPFNRRAKILIWLYSLFYFGKRIGGKRPLGIGRHLPLEAAEFIRRDETSDDEFGSAHVIIAIKTW